MGRDALPLHAGQSALLERRRHHCQLFMALVGAVSIFLCAWFLQNPVLKRDDMRRDLLARDRANRLAKERASQRN